MFGTDVECWAVAEFYRSVNVEANTAECDSVRSFNYICGCSDSPGYAGADSDARKTALVWFPRVGAILSMLVRDPKLTTMFCTFNTVASINSCCSIHDLSSDNFILSEQRSLLSIVICFA